MGMEGQARGRDDQAWFELDKTTFVSVQLTLQESIAVMRGENVIAL